MRLKAADEANANSLSLRHKEDKSGSGSCDCVMDHLTRSHSLLSPPSLPLHLTMISDWSGSQREQYNWQMTSANQVIVAMITERKCYLIGNVAVKACTQWKSASSIFRWRIFFFEPIELILHHLLLPFRGSLFWESCNVEWAMSRVCEGLGLGTHACTLANRNTHIHTYTE